MPEGTMKSYIDPYLVIKNPGVAAYIVIVYLIFSFFGKERDITPVIQSARGNESRYRRLSY